MIDELLHCGLQYSVVSPEKERSNINIQFEGRGWLNLGKKGDDLC